MVGPLESNRPNSSFRSCNWNVKVDDNVLLLEVDTHLVATHFPAIVSEFRKGAKIEFRSSKPAFSHGQSDSFPIFRVGDSSSDVY